MKKNVKIAFVNSRKTGKLYVVATPIGSLDDITLRGIEVLKKVDYILSENTRVTTKLLDHYNIKTAQKIYTDQKHDTIIISIENDLLSGKNIALVSDNGTPVISDPGFKLVNHLRKNGFELSTVPGPSAVTSALSVSGLPTDNYLFLGFLVKQQQKREKILKKYEDIEATICIYESSHRIEKLLSQIESILGNRVVFIAKDLTKKFESTYYGEIQNFKKDSFNLNKGEYVVLIAKGGIKA